MIRLFSSSRAASFFTTGTLSPIFQLWFCTLWENKFQLMKFSIDQASTRCHGIGWNENSTKISITKCFSFKQLRGAALIKLFHRRCHVTEIFRNIFWNARCVYCSAVEILGYPQFYPENFNSITKLSELNYKYRSSSVDYLERNFNLRLLVQAINWER